MSDKTLPLDRAVDSYFDGKPITYRDCILKQCGPVALLYAERIQELALAAKDEEVMDMALCESASCVLRIGQLYRFRPVGDCKTCAEMKARHDEAYGSQGEKA
jgi:hypothetical protein